MKKNLLVLFMMVCLLFLVSCGKNNEPSVRKTITEEEWNNIVINHGFAKDADTNLVIKFYTSPDVEDEPDFILYKNGLLYKFVTIVSGNEYISYGDFENNIGYKYYGINRANYYKLDIEETIDETLDIIIRDFDIEYNKVKFEKGEYISTIPYEGNEKYAHYSFNDGVLKEFNVYFENELDYKMTIEPMNNQIVFPNASFIDEMPTSEMKTYIKEALKELKSYGAIGGDYSVEDYEHYTLATFEYLRLKNSDDTYKTLEQLVNEIKSNLVDKFFSGRVGVIEQVESLDDFMWFGMFEDGNQNGLIIKLVPTDGKLIVNFAVTDFDVLNILALKEYLENRLVDDADEDEFYFDGSVMIDTKDCLLIQYDTEMTGEYEELLSYALTCVGDNGYEWTESGSGYDYHYEILEHDNKAVRLYFTNVEENKYNIKITFCISFGDEDASTIIDFGVDAPLFE